jgi:hypothetical protein
MHFSYKNDLKLGINYLHGELGDTINPIFSALASNLKNMQQNRNKSYHEVE